MYEVITEEVKPFKNVPLVEIKIANDPKFRPIFPQSILNDETYTNIITLIKSCWAHDAKERPTSWELCSQLENLKIQ